MRPSLSAVCRRLPPFVALAGLAWLTAGCSAEITRLDNSFFSREETVRFAGRPAGGFTGSLPPKPQAAVGRGHDQAMQVAAAPVGAITSTALDAREAGYQDGMVITAQQGDSVYDLSRRHGVSARDIMAANNMHDSDRLTPGQRVRIPSSTGHGQPSLSQGAPMQAAHHAAAPQAPAQSIRGVHRVEQGETLVAIAQRYQVSAFQIANANGMRPTDPLYSGQELRIPHAGDGQGMTSAQPVQVASLDAREATAMRAPLPAARPAHHAPQRAHHSAPERAEPMLTAPAQSHAQPEPQTTPGPAVSDGRNAASPQPAGEPEDGQLRPRERQVAAHAPLPDPQETAQSGLRWPVRGRIISEFGPKPNGAHNDGINIAVPEGASIKAAEGGVVAYAGNELKGYGNLILIRHDDGVVTAYAHASEIAVQRGDRVQRGQIIGKAGQTGSVNQPQLHFEVRRNSRPVDPMPLMAGG